MPSNPIRTIHMRRAADVWPGMRTHVGVVVSKRADQWNDTLVVLTFGDREVTYRRGERITVLPD